MLFAAVFALVLATVPPAGGRLAALGDLALTRRGYLVGTLALQVIALYLVADLPQAVPRGAHLASYALLGAFLWGNRHVPGLALAAFGGALNLLAIAANGGVIPASEAALRRAGLPPTLEGFNNSEALVDPRLAWLGDVFALPSGLPFATVFSVGDVIIMVGVAYGLHAVCGSRPVAALRRRRAAVAAS